MKNKVLKWGDREQVKDLLEKAIFWLENDKEGKKEFQLIGITLHFKISSSEYAHARESFVNDSEIIKMFEHIDKTLEHRIVKGATGKNYSSNFSKFLLTNRHADRYKEKQEIAVSVNGSLTEALKILDKE